MDKLTDLLSTFFVASQNNKQKNTQESNKKNFKKHSSSHHKSSHSHHKSSHSHHKSSHSHHKSSHSDKKHSSSDSSSHNSHSSSDKNHSDSYHKSDSSNSNKKRSESHNSSDSSNSNKKRSESHNSSDSSNSDKKRSESHNDSSSSHKVIKNISDKIKSNTTTTISTESVNLESKSKRESKKSEEKEHVDVYSDLSSIASEEKNNEIFENNNIVKEYYKNSSKQNVQKILENDKEYKKVHENFKENEKIKQRIKEEMNKKLNVNSENSENDNILKKYVLKPTEFYKKNIFIVSDDIKTSTDILSDLLHKISLINNLDKIYDNQINIISNIENKKIYKQMLLENPYLYFTDLNVKNTLHKNRIDSIDENLRTIFIFDDEMALQYIDYVEALINKNVHVFILSNEDCKNGYKLYNIFGSSKLLLYKPSKSKLVQKRFYKNFIHSFYKDGLDFDQYYNKINNENIDIKYIILKDIELRYN